MRAPVVELVDALDSKSSTVRFVGSSPTGGTIFSQHREKLRPAWDG